MQRGRRRRGCDKWEVVSQSVFISVCPITIRITPQLSFLNTPPCPVCLSLHLSDATSTATQECSSRQDYILVKRQLLLFNIIFSPENQKYLVHIILRLQIQQYFQFLITPLLSKPFQNDITHSLGMKRKNYSISQSIKDSL